MILAFKITALVIAIWFTSINAISAKRGQAVTPANLFVMSLSIALFLALEGWI